MLTLRFPMNKQALRCRIRLLAALLHITPPWAPLEVVLPVDLQEALDGAGKQLRDCRPRSGSNGIGTAVRASPPPLGGVGQQISHRRALAGMEGQARWGACFFGRGHTGCSMAIGLSAPGTRRERGPLGCWWVGQGRRSPWRRACGWAARLRHGHSLSLRVASNAWAVGGASGYADYVAVHQTLSAHAVESVLATALADPSSGCAVLSTLHPWLASIFNLLRQLALTRDPRLALHTLTFRHPVDGGFDSQGSRNSRACRRLATGSRWGMSG